MGMEKKQIMKIVTRSTIALVIPLAGQLFINGWNWGLGDFVFTWVFFNALGFAYTFVTNNITHRSGKIIGGIIVVALFVFIWIKLATG